MLPGRAVAAALVLGQVVAAVRRDEGSGLGVDLVLRLGGVEGLAGYFEPSFSKFSMIFARLGLAPGSPWEVTAQICW